MKKRKTLWLFGAGRLESCGTILQTIVAVGIIYRDSCIEVRKVKSSGWPRRRFGALLESIYIYTYRHRQGYHAADFFFWFTLELVWVSENLYGCNNLSHSEKVLTVRLNLCVILFIFLVCQ